MACFSSQRCQVSVLQHIVFGQTCVCLQRKQKHWQLEILFAWRLGIALQGLLHGRGIIPTALQRHYGSGYNLCVQIHPSDLHPDCKQRTSLCDRQEEMGRRTWGRFLQSDSFEGRKAEVWSCNKATGMGQEDGTKQSPGRWEELLEGRGRGAR